jgi:NAD(P)-dependent dehydrogenase (short-subunit alcohol dehydrogenase family)
MTASSLKGRSCLVTGAGTGIGRAIALALAAAGADVTVVGRRRRALDETAELADPGRIVVHPADLAVDEHLTDLTSEIADRALDALVHCAGAYAQGSFEQTPVEELDRQYRINVRAPFRLTQALLPALKASQGEIVFVNSTVGLIARANVGPYAATKHALKALADALRDEINPAGVRVFSVYPGRTATERQALIYELEGRAYVPEALMQPEDVAATVLAALTLPRTAELTDLRVRPMRKH